MEKRSHNRCVMRSKLRKQNLLYDYCAFSTGLKEGTSKRKVEEKRKVIVEDFESAYNRVLYAAVPDKNVFSIAPRRKFTDYLDSWLETVKPTIAFTTYKGYAKNVRRIKGYFQEYNLMLNDVKPVHIQNFYTNSRSFYRQNRQIE